MTLVIPKVISIECKHDAPKKEWPEINHKGINFKLTLCSECEIRPQFEPLLGGKI